MSENGGQASRDQVLSEIRGAEKFILVTHENPDGDALGSLQAMHEVLDALGKDSLMFMSPDEFPLPYEYRFFPWQGLISVPPADLDERTVIFLDCGNIDRNPAEILRDDERHIVNIDHHHDNTRFGTVNHVVPEASCTAEIVWDLMRGLGVEPTLTIAEALYVGLVTDTGKFMYENTGHARAPDGRRADRGRRRRPRDLPAPLRGRALRQARAARPRARQRRALRRRAAHAHPSDQGRLRRDRRRRELLGGRRRPPALSRGHGGRGLVRDLLAEDKAGRRKVSLRATDDRVDVSEIARAHGGGGHRQAAGFSTELGWDELSTPARGDRAQL